MRFSPDRIVAAKPSGTGRDHQAARQLFAEALAVEGEALAAATTTATTSAGLRGVRRAAAGSGFLWQTPLEPSTKPLSQLICKQRSPSALLALAANERTDAAGLGAHRIERIEACELDVEFGAGVLVELLERLLRAARSSCRRSESGITADTLQMRLQQTARCRPGRSAGVGSAPRAGQPVVRAARRQRDLLLPVAPSSRLLRPDACASSTAWRLASST